MISLLLFLRHFSICLFSFHFSFNFNLLLQVLLLMNLFISLYVQVLLMVHVRSFFVSYFFHFVVVWVLGSGLTAKLVLKKSSTFLPVDCPIWWFDSYRKHERIRHRSPFNWCGLRFCFTWETGVYIITFGPLICILGLIFKFILTNLHWLICS